ncbi:spore gernimation protein KC [Bacillus sp. FJAT-18017]|uniref:GerAB/ArcD/ProY family transporter n=1 Tax=Bacillus sp. FJAT-18017 TaxID=1705566 RepID=UPI0006AE31A8|nr:endospore germination permease [Bacillus sp. FJAT-18017]ALC91215.1 spore gernimation protein KC [Bacillus sp. FJAT-18017]
MAKENISLVQLLMLVVNFELGSSIVVGLGQGAGNDAWIAIGGASLFGVALLWLYYALSTRMENHNLYTVIEFCFGRKLGIILAFFYISYFTYLAARVIRDFCELLSSAILPNTPMEVMSLTLCLVLGYILYLGIEVLARTNEIFSPYLLLFLLMLTIFLIASGGVDPKQLLPLFGNGASPIIKQVFPELITFPYGEMVAFTLIFPLVTRKSHIKHVAFLGLATATFLLILAEILTVMSLGVDAMQRSNFPLLTVARNVSIGGFVERIEVLVVFIMLLGILVKSSVFLFGALKGMEYVYRLPFRYFALPGAMLVSLFSVLVSVNFADHIEEGIKLVPKYLHLPFQIGFPVSLFLTMMIKLFIMQKKGNGQIDEHS